MSDYTGNGIILGVQDPSNRGDQPISEEKKAFVRSIYDLFESFKMNNLEYLTEIQIARAIRRLEDPALDSAKAKGKRPQLNTLNSTMDNMIADYVDNMPEVILSPETRDSEEIARQMTDVMGWVLYHADLPAAWKLAVDDATVTGTGVIQDHFDPLMDVGGVEGNIGLLNWPPESWLPDPLYDDFQQGRAVFKVCKHPMSYFVQHYPKEAPYIAPDGESRMDYTIDGENPRTDYEYDDPTVCLLEVWYRRFNPETGRYAIHMAKVAGNVLLEDTRDNEGTKDGVYVHGQYPFTVLRFRKRKGTAYGAGICHEYADTQRMINRFMGYIDENIRESAKFKMLVSKTAGIDISALTDYNQEVVQADNRLSNETIQWQQPRPLNSLAPTMMNALQDTMKQDSGQNQWARGEGGQGVTAASAINMLQNAGGKISRMHITDFINDFRYMCDRIISMIGQFFKDQRIFTIYGEQGGSDMRQVEFDPEKVFGGVEAYRKPAFTVRVMPQRSSPDQVESFNQKVLRMVELSANQNPIPPVAIAKMLQMTGKEQMIPVLEEADAQHQAMIQMQQQLEQMAQQLQAVAGENEQLKKGLTEASQEIQQKQQIMAAIGQQMSSGSNASAPSMPDQTGAQAVQTAS